MATQTRTETMTRPAAHDIVELEKPRLPYHTDVTNRFGVDRGQWRVLCESIFPSAKSFDSIVMALSYCKARNLDIFKKPVNIVPMWNSSLGREVETVWPSINEIQTSAARTSAWAGMDEPKWGPDETRSFKGRKKTKDGWESVEVAVTFPQWCAVTVYRLVGGQRYAFTEPVYWLEAYSRAGGAKSELPTDMWVKRPRGQMHKVAKAASLRAAFPEEGSYTAEEMAGQEIEDGGIVIEHKPTASPSPPSPPSPPSRNVRDAAPSPQPQPDYYDPETGEVWTDDQRAPSPPTVPTNGNGFTDDEKDWLRNLEGAFGGCEGMVELGERKTALMNPMKKKVSGEAWARAETLFRERFDKLTAAE